MNVTKVKSVNFGSNLQTLTTKKVLNRSLLKTQKNNLKDLAGPNEVRKARAWVAAYTAGNASIAGLTAQAGGLEEVALSGVEAVMAAHIFNGIYDFKLSKTLLESLATAVKGHFIGKTAYKLASKGLTWIPGLGNALNAIVAGTTTATLGAYLIDKAEEFEKAKKRGMEIDEFIRRMKE